MWWWFEPKCRETEVFFRHLLDVFRLVNVIMKGFNKTYLIPVVHVCCLVSLEYPWNQDKDYKCARQREEEEERGKGSICPNADCTVL